MSANLYKAAARQIAAIDPAPYVAAIAERTAERRTIQEAIESGRHEMGLLARKITDAKYAPRIDADQAADALLSGGAIEIEVDAIEKLQLQQKGLDAGLRRLRDREDEAADAESQAKLAAIGVLSRCVTDLPSVLIQEAAEALERVAGIYAALNALASATGNIDARSEANKLEKVVMASIDERLVPNGSIPVPGEMREMFLSVEETIAALGGRIVNDVTRPFPAPNYMLAAMGEQNANLRAEIAALRAA